VGILIFDLFYFLNPGSKKSFGTKMKNILKNQITYSKRNLMSVVNKYLLKMRELYLEIKMLREENKRLKLEIERLNRPKWLREPESFIDSAAIETWGYFWKLQS
jgi:hypothetical protein